MRSSSTGSTRTVVRTTHAAAVSRSAVGPGVDDRLAAHCRARQQLYTVTIGIACSNSEAGLECLFLPSVLDGQPLAPSAFIGSLSHSYPHIMWGPAHATRTRCPAKTRHGRVVRQPVDIRQPVVPFRLTRTSRDSRCPSSPAGTLSCNPPTAAYAAVGTAQGISIASP